MKITSVDIFLLRHVGEEFSPFPFRPAVCRVNTDEGICGYGEAGISVGTGENGVAYMLKDLSQLVLGKDPMNNEVIWEDIHNVLRGPLSGGGVTVYSAMSALDTAMMDIKGKKLGVIGLGAIGAEVANTAAALGMEVYGYDPYISINAAWALSRDVKHITSVDTIYQECDYITVHVPLLDSTRGMINGQTTGQMKDGVVVLNFARDLLVDDDAMAAALETGKVRRYVTDFPNPKSVAMKNVIAIPHLGASTEESEDNCAKMAVEELMDYLENGNIRNSVNYPNCDMGVCHAASRVAVLHLNVPNMIGQITGVLAAGKINISDMTNKSRDKFAYPLMDLEHTPDDIMVQKLNAIEGVLRVRLI